MVSRKRYEEMVEFYDKRIEELKRDVEYWRNHWIETAKHSDKVDIYEEILAKQGILGKSSSYTDKTFIFEGKVYTPRSYTLTRDPGKHGELDVEFVEQYIPELETYL